MSINTSGDKEFTCTVNDFCVFVGYNGCNFGNFTILNEDISLLRKICVDDSGVLEKITLSESDVREERFVEKLSHF